MDPSNSAPEPPKDTEAEKELMHTSAIAKANESLKKLDLRDVLAGRVCQFSTDLSNIYLTNALAGSKTKRTTERNVLPQILGYTACTSFR